MLYWNKFKKLFFVDVDDCCPNGYACKNCLLEFVLDENRYRKLSNACFKDESIAQTTTAQVNSESTTSE